MFVNKDFLVPDYSSQFANPLAQQNFCVFEVKDEDIEAAKRILHLRFFDPSDIFKNSESILGKPEKWYVLGSNIVGVNTWSKVPIADQYFALNNTATIFPATTMQFVKVKGAGAGALLDFASPRVISDLEIHASRFTFFTNPSGSIDDEAVIIRTGADEFVMSCGSGRIPYGLKHGGVTMDGASVEEVDVSILIIFGPQKLEALNSLILPKYHNDAMQLKAFHSCMVELTIGGFARVLKTLIGYEIWADGAAVASLWDYAITKEKPIIPCGWDVLNTFRLECDKFVFKLYPMDMGAGTTLWEVDGGWLIDKNNDRDFIGKKPLLDLEDKKRCWFGGLKSEKEGDDIKNKIPNTGDPVFCENQVFAGYITSSCFSPKQNRVLVFAHLANHVSIGDTVTIEGEKYVISKLPF